jgi:putative redox protein
MADNDKKKIIHIHIGGSNYKTTLTAGNHELISDEPESKGGKDLGPDPYDYLLMSLGSCTVITMKMYADRKKWAVEEIFVELRHFKDHVEDCVECKDPNAKIDMIEKEITVKGDLNQEKIDRLLEISKKCPVHKTLLGQMEIHSVIERR